MFLEAQWHCNIFHQWGAECSDQNTLVLNTEFWHRRTSILSARFGVGIQSKEAHPTYFVLLLFFRNRMLLIDTLMPKSSRYFIYDFENTKISTLKATFGSFSLSGFRWKEQESWFVYQKPATNNQPRIKSLIEEIKLVDREKIAFG